MAGCGRGDGGGAVAVLFGEQQQRGRRVGGTAGSSTTLRSTAQGYSGSGQPSGQGAEAAGAHQPQHGTGTARCRGGAAALTSMHFL